MDECSQIQVTALDIMYSITTEAEHIVLLISHDPLQLKSVVET